MVPLGPTSSPPPWASCCTRSSQPAPPGVTRVAAVASHSDEPAVVVIGDPTLAEAPAPSNQATANRAKAILCDARKAFRDPSAPERSAVAAAFAAKNFVVYGRAFDLVEVGDRGITLTDQDALLGAI